MGQKENYKKWYYKNREKYLKIKKEYYNKNKDKRTDYQKKYREENRDKINKSHKEYYDNNRNKECKKSKEYYKKNRDKMNAASRKYYKENKDKFKEYNKRYREENKSKIKAKQREYSSRKRKEDIIFKFKENIRGLIYRSLRDKKDSKTEEILGCSFNEFMNYLNNNKYGFSYGDNEVDMDHVIPTSSATSKEDIIKLNHHTNFQLLPSEYNRFIKRDKTWDQNHFDDWMDKDA